MATSTQHTGSPAATDAEAAPALIVIDVQNAFDDAAYWGERNNPAAEENIAALIDAWQEADRPVVFVRHDSVAPGSPLRTGQRGNDFKEVVERRRGRSRGPELLVTKTVNSAFLGTPDLDSWLRETGVGRIVVAGIQTNMCVETTARMGDNLGYRVLFPLDATHTFDLSGPWGLWMSADELARTTAVNLHGGDFAEVLTTKELLAREAPA